MTDFHFDRASFDRWVNQPGGPVAKDLERRAIRVQTEAVRSVHEPGKGRQYGAHRASAPGDPPATDTGQLAASITHRIGTDGRGLFAFVGSKLKKVRYLELGTSRIAPRPFLRRALRKAGGR